MAKNMSKGAKIATGAGGGAASGLALGTSIAPGWGSLIGAGVGAGFGALGAGLGARAEEEKEEEMLRRQDDIYSPANAMSRRQQNMSGIDMLASLRGAATNRAAQMPFRDALARAMRGQ